jgi:hypothetical protein
LAGVVGVHFNDLSKIENGKLDFGDSTPPAEADPPSWRPPSTPTNYCYWLAGYPRVLERPDAFRRLAALDDDALDNVLAGMAPPATTGARPRKRA